MCNLFERWGEEFCPLEDKQALLVYNLSYFKYISIASIKLYPFGTRSHFYTKFNTKKLIPSSKRDTDGYTLSLCIYIYIYIPHSPHHKSNRFICEREPYTIKRGTFYSSWFDIHSKKTYSTFRTPTRKIGLVSCPTVSHLSPWWQCGTTFRGATGTQGPWHAQPCPLHTPPVCVSPPLCLAGPVGTSARSQPLLGGGKTIHRRKCQREGARSAYGRRVMHLFPSTFSSFGLNPWIFKTYLGVCAEFCVQNKV